MTYNETLAVFKILKTAYPNFIKDQSKEEINNMASLWAEMFADDNTELVCMAVKSYIATDESGFAPSIGKLKTIIRKFNPEESLSGQQAWNLVSKAVDYYHYSKNYQALPEDIQKVLGSAEQLREWSLIESPTTWQVVASNFMKSYEMVKKRKEEILALPKDIQKLLSSEQLLIKEMN